LDYLEEEWWIEIEQFSTSQFSLMRNNLQTLCTVPKYNKLRQLLINQVEP